MAGLAEEPGLLYWVR